MHKETVLDCSDNPYDLRPGADLIVEEALRRYEIARAKGRPFVLLLGETHSVAADIAMQQKICSRLLDHDIDFSVGFEMDSNLVAHAIEYRSRTKLGDGFPYRIGEYTTQKDSAAALFFMFNYAGIFAPHAQKALLRFCYMNRIPVGLNDTGMIRSQDGNTALLDVNDPFMLDDYGLASLHPGITHISPISAIGVRLRNYSMVKRSLSMGDFIVQMCGAAHVFGAQRKLPESYVGDRVFMFSDSLYAQFSPYADVLPVFLSDMSDGLPSDFPAEGVENIKIRGLSMKEFSYANVSVEDGKALCQAEVNHLHRLFTESGGGVGYHWTSKLVREFLSKEYDRHTNEIMAHFGLV